LRADPPPARRDHAISRSGAPFIRRGRPELQARRDALDRFRRGDDGEHLEVDQIASRGNPLFEEGAILALHQLVAGRHVGRHPARDVGQALGETAPLVPEAPVHGHRITILEALDDHVEHRSPFWSAAERRSRNQPSTDGSLSSPSQASASARDRKTPTFLVLRLSISRCAPYIRPRANSKSRGAMMASRVAGVRTSIPAETDANRTMRSGEGTATCSAALMSISSSYPATSGRDQTSCWYANTSSSVSVPIARVTTSRRR